MGEQFDYVGKQEKRHVADPTSRERSGTPGVLQNTRAALAMYLKQLLDPAIQDAEEKHLAHVFERHASDPVLKDCVEMVQVPITATDTPAPEAKDRVGIFSYLVKMNIDGEVIADKLKLPALVSPSLVATILDDFARIMTRAGCSCAGPYGHEIYNISPEQEPRFADWITAQEGQPGFSGFKLGWERWNAHPTMTTGEVNYFLDMFKMVVQNISKLMPLYNWDPKSGKWTLDAEKLPKKMPKPPKVEGKLKVDVFKAQIKWMEKFVSQLEQADV